MKMSEIKQALQAARDIVDACAGDNRPAKVRTQIDAAVAEREPVAFVSANAIRHHITSGTSQTGTVLHREQGELYGERHLALYLDPPPTSELEAEIARLKAELDCALIREGNEKHHAKISHQNMNAEINARERTEARLAEALKALEPFASVALLDQTPDAPRGMWVSVPFGWLQDARRVREGGKVDG